jgi:hypothetical protein
MCMGGGGKTADQFYEEIKPTFAPLPSLSMGEPVQREGAQYRSITPVKRTGAARRSLLMPFMMGSSNGR